jgi:CubicO group peptidase (beta-lactamase class C family)
MKKILVSLSFSFSLFITAVHAQVIETNAKQNTTVNYQRLKRIDTLISDYINKNWETGVVTIVVKDNQIVQYKGYGYSDVDTKTPMKNDAIFRIMSQTKAITSAGIMILYEHGKLLLDEPIADFIPEFKNPVVVDKFNAADTTYTTVPAKRDITFRDLLTHTSGIDYADIGTAEGNAIYAKAGVPSGLGYFNAKLLEKMKVLAKLPLMFQPGEKWQYGLNSDLLGCLIEVHVFQCARVKSKQAGNSIYRRFFKSYHKMESHFSTHRSRLPAYEDALFFGWRRSFLYRF